MRLNMRSNCLEVLCRLSRIWSDENCLILLAPLHSHNRKNTQKTPMELNIEGFDGKKYVVDVDVDDTAKDLRQKVAATTGFC